MAVFLWKKAYMNSEEFWEKIRNSLKFIQGNGSGYDVGVQLVASENATCNTRPQFWVFQNQKGNSIPIIEKLDIKNDTTCFGSFILTHIYSDTAKAVKKFLGEKNKTIIAAKHAQLAENFLVDSSLISLKNEMGKSQKIAIDQGLLPMENKKFYMLVTLLKDKNIPFKTMGSGHGDCLWVLANKETLINECQIPEKDISFMFENMG